MCKRGVFEGRVGRRGVLAAGALLLLGSLFPARSAAQAREARSAAAPQADSALVQPLPHRFQPKRFWTGMAAVAVADMAVMYGLSQLWYGGQERGPFQFYSDRMAERYGPEYDDGWLDDWDNYVQQDKLGHAVVAWHLARAFGEFGRWSGLSRRQAGLFGGTMSGLFQSQIEFFDAFSYSYGFSRTDVLANFVGAAAGGLQVAYPELTWFTAKYSYHASPYYDEGTNWVGNALKDYDGISYWFVVRPERLLPEAAAARWPDWLALSVGYSGTGLAHSLSGRTEEGGLGGPVHRRQFYIGPDLDVLTAYDWPQPFRAIAGFLSFARIPAPALQLTPELRWYWVFY